jgi:hypothetical protein
MRIVSRGLATARSSAAPMCVAAGRAAFPSRERWAQRGNRLRARIPGIVVEKAHIRATSGEVRRPSAHRPRPGPDQESHRIGRRAAHTTMVTDQSTATSEVRVAGWTSGDTLYVMNNAIIRLDTEMPADLHAAGDATRLDLRRRAAAVIR